jgi:Copper transport outer membrane protein, MctB
MIDFRYHLISIIAVLMALAIGILAGSGFLGGPLLADLRHRLNNIAHDNSGLQKDVATLTKTTQDNQVFAEATEPWLVQRALAAHTVVLLESQGTETAASDGIVSSIVDAGGTVTATVTFTDKLSLTDPTALNQLALSVHSSSGSARKVRDQAAVLLGDRAAAASRAPDIPPSESSAESQRFEALLAQLEKDGFVGTDRTRDGITVPPGALFVVLAGAVDHPPFPARSFCLDLARSLGAHAATVLAAEPSDSTWGFVAAVRADGKAAQTVATVDDAETVPGGIATVLGLREAIRGRIGHYGFAPGADAVIPQPAVSPS